VKKVRIALCTFEIANVFTVRSSEVLTNRRNTEREEKKVTVEKRQKRAGATPFLRGEAAQTFRWVAPALRHDGSCRPFFHGDKNSEQEEHHADR
jgi:hypothetical protein